MKRLAVIGNPIEHSLSPIMHQASFLSQGLQHEFSYEALRIEADELPLFVRKLETGEYWGVNITVPYKESIVQYIKRIDPEAKNIGAINTIYRNTGNNELWGTNTDASGFIASLQSENIAVDGLTCLVLGAGGAAKAICYALLTHGGKVLLYNRAIEKARLLATFLTTFGTINVIPTIKLASYDILVNCTSVGMDKKTSPINPEYILPKSTVIDIIYNPANTPLLQAAKEKKCLTVNGIGMLLEQGALAYRYFTGRQPDRAVMKAALLRRIINANRS
jgi:shikimate dehydrogenase